MPCCRFGLFCVVFIICISLCVGSSHVKMCVETDRRALLKLKDGFINGRDILTSWNGEDCCKWKGISCDNLTGHVTSLDLQNGLVKTYDYVRPQGGKIDYSICELQHLTSLNLKYNNLVGKIPRCIGSLGRLMELNLAANELVSAIPPSLGNLSNLQTLDLRYNIHLAVNDLEWLSRLSNLRYLGLSSVNLSRVVDWPSSILTKIPSLSKLHLQYCRLHQVNPEIIPHLNSSTSLKYLDLSGNNLNSSILSWVLNVSKVLTFLDLSFNSLLHNIPDDFANMTSLQHLDLSYNELEGSIPKSFKSLCQLKELYLDSNKLVGNLSDIIQQLCSAQNDLKGLGLGGNPFSSGSFLDFSCFSSLETLRLRNTNVVGPLSPSFGQLPSLEYVDLYHNQLNGVDIINEAHLSKLRYLDLSFNLLSGSLPLFDVAKLVTLEYLDLSHNQLNGSLPHIISQCSGLRRLLLSSNKLNGVIGEAHLSNLSRLTILDVSENSLSFYLSSNWVPPFQLRVLYASSCTLGPKFPKWLKHQRELKVLQISNNNILVHCLNGFGTYLRA